MLFAACTKKGVENSTTTSGKAESLITTEEITTTEGLSTTTTEAITTTEITEVETTEKETTTKVHTETTTKPATTVQTTQAEATTAVETTKMDLPTYSGPSAEELQTVELLNVEREKAGLHPLTFNYEAYNCARLRAEETLVQLSHTRPDGRRCFTVFEDYGVCLNKSKGENICYGYRSLQSAVDTLMGSQTHKDNILRYEFNSVAIGIAPLGDGRYTMVQLFVS